MADYGKKYEVIVVGAGHAGCEAALAAARMGCQTLLLTIGLDTVAQMSCNPSIGGLGKGHLVHEIDALGGEMARNIDATGIQFRRLNMRKGPAVRAGRAQADRMQYSARMKQVVESEPCLDLKQGLVEGLVVGGGRVLGVRTREGIYHEGRAVVLTTGTFMRGLIHVGLSHYPGGRAGEPAAEGLSLCLVDLGFDVGRLKTGTPARLAARTIDLGRLEKQFGDRVIRPFSFMTDNIGCEQVNCYIAHTNEKTHEIIRKSLHLSPLYAGIIEGVGPRYCPSIEDKVVRFADKQSHQSFLEPEGRNSGEMYPSGLSTSLPADVQLAYFRSMVGFESVEIMRPGYAIEYDYVEPRQLKPTLETKLIEGLFHAGQINGTSGYEEAAAQGLMAGINAALKCRDREPLVLRRDQAYIGVMIDDLVTRETTEPYRMFTSRAEYRLLLREDNADRRLTEIGRGVGLVTDERWQRYERKEEAIAGLINALRNIKVTEKNDELMAELGVNALPAGSTFEKLLKRPDIGIDQLVGLDDALAGYEAAVLEQVEIGLKYEGYIQRQREQVESFKGLEAVQIPEGIDYQKVPGLTIEVREKMERYRPVSLGQASRLQGVTPAAIAIMQVYLRKLNNERRPC